MEQRKEPAAASTTPSSGGEGAANAPLVDAQKRERCWAARDAYHACIDGSKTGGGEEECGAALRLYAAECPRSWLLHFEKRRKADQERSAREAAYQNRQRG
ncbi:uncharacterized protein ACA1_143600 [Acanthamoeba castellanii str. Neff]|uniref:Cytochrome c oxidase assembly factor 6 n=1 Tax=Acanthamoeba castellanii (strain ATCC 30010 / Neff) TaxID=1257118 RepID=L8HFQ0_ACACF|nr:uncharacterized protein ACA1_143600 [Acanthamoeba castellanii str. Neff]ELR23980.1 hypothetical protein ACA1_143600 [Acanthamoeba castellanii str. Neff]